jgi:amino acid permease
MTSSLARRKNLSNIGAVLAFISTIIGGGVVGLPFAVYYTGIPLGIAMNLIVSLMTIYSTYLYLLCKDLTGNKQ